MVTFIKPKIIPQINKVFHISIPSGEIMIHGCKFSFPDIKYHRLNKISELNRIEKTIFIIIVLRNE
jgi:hypothetical protein